MRIRTDFFSRPPRVDVDLAWAREQEAVVDRETLVRMKFTMREKDYPFIGALAEQMEGMEDRARYGRSAEELLRMREAIGVGRFEELRPALAGCVDREAIEEALDRERRRLMRADEVRLARYEAAARTWRERWMSLKLAELDLVAAHARMVEEAMDVLPFEV